MRVFYPRQADFSVLTFSHLLSLENSLVILLHTYQCVKFTLLNVSRSGHIAVCSNFDPRSHRGGDDTAPDVLTFSCSGLSLDNSVKKGLKVLNELIPAEGCLAYRAVDDIALVKPVFDLTGFGISNSSRYVR